MKKGLFLFGLLCVATLSQAESYHLTRDTMLVDGGRYVFEKNNRVWIAQITDGALQTTNTYTKTNLSGTENYVWLAQKKPEGFKLTCNGYSLDQPNTKEAKLSLVQSSLTSTRWKPCMTTDDSVRIWSQDSLRSVGLSSKSSNVFQVYSGSTTDHPSRLALHRLDLDSYERTLGNYPLGTICLPFTAETATGATFYEVAYKEVDGSGNPTSIVFQEVDGELVAGHAYVFEPTASKISFKAVPDSYVAKPISSSDNKGLKGTFVPIQDKNESSLTTNKLEGKYMISSEGKIQKCGVGCSLGSYRAYINMDNVPLKESAPAPTRSLLRLTSNAAPEHSQPTDLVEVFPASQPMRKVMEQGGLLIIQGNQKYTILGQQL